MIKFNDVILSNDNQKDYTIARFNPNIDIITDKEFILKLPNLDIIKNQGNINSCVAFSIVLGRAIQEYNQNNMWINFSPSMLYGTRYPSHYKGEGMIPREALSVINNEGVFFEKEFSKNEEVPQLYSYVDIVKLNNKNAVEVASQYKITGYARLNTINEIKSALKLNMPILSAYQLYENFMRTGKDGVVPTLKTTDKFLGNHAMLIVGWTKNNEWLVLNSWSNDYGYKGLYKIPFNYTLVEAWSMSDTIMPSKIKAKSIKLKIDSNEIIVDDVVKTIDTPPTIINNRTMLPIRVISESLGASVEWIESSKGIVIRSPEAKLELFINSRTFKCDGVVKEMDVSPVIVNNRTLIPIRFIAENLNCDIEWNENDRSILIKCK